MKVLLGKSLAVALLGLGVSVPLNAATVTFESSQGNNGFPFNIDGANLPSQHYQQIYSATPFGTSSVSITGLSFRPFRDSRSTAFGPSTLPSISISLGYSPTTYLTPSSTYASNITGAKSVRSGPLTLSSSGGAAYDILVPIGAFTYDPTLGDLVVDIFNNGGGTTTQFEFGAGLFSRVYSYSDPNGSSGTIQVGRGLATQFTTSAIAAAVPEVSTWAMMVGGLGMVGGSMRYRRRQQVRVTYA
jgi:hypothetical protein